MSSNDPWRTLKWTEWAQAAPTVELYACLRDSSRPSGWRAAAGTELAARHQRGEARGEARDEAIEFLVRVATAADPELRESLIDDLAALDDEAARDAVEGFAVEGDRTAIDRLAARGRPQDRVLARLAAEGNVEAIDALVRHAHPLGRGLALSLLESSEIHDQERGYLYFLRRGDDDALRVLSERDDRVAAKARNRALATAARTCWRADGASPRRFEEPEEPAAKRAATMSAELFRALQEAGFVAPPRPNVEPVNPRGRCVPPAILARELERHARFRRNSVGVESTLPGKSLLESLGERLDLAVTLIRLRHRSGVEEMQRWVEALRRDPDALDPERRECVLAKAEDAAFSSGGYIAYFFEKPAAQRIAILLAKLDDVARKLT